MPILATIAAITALRGTADVPSFFTPDTLRSRLDDVLNSEDNPRREAATQILDRLETSTRLYRTAVSDAVDEYLLMTQDGSASEKKLSRRLAPIDKERQETVEAIVGLRSELLELLGPDEWYRLFDA